ncbi:mannitol-1-phosphate 5-dehydrogenase [Gottfriedia solisilvae]|uniref:Mannitol-1-phosphate 5-dehydrogenase n=1 Tax=Gottfriedia solisilvae TaxID=1516104 RepID=A0A8J3AJI6_9BACI|nr:mannitol-1-phosphate 5-dehydrogenase [Gottfriedia solisilvae]GGI13944.1 mannitol-1-phosphate 5-dehydrogenase [Gottfriedia solisilvae]
MLAVHFGAGNIGRGFIGQLLHNAGYEICFVDVNEEIINELNKKKSYTVMLADRTQEKIKITNVRGINSLKDPQEVTKIIAKADIVTTAVGPTILPRIAKLIADGLIERETNLEKPLNIIACENMIGGSSYLRDEVYAYMTFSQKVKTDQSVYFPDAAVDRIVPIQSHEDALLVAVEPFYEWVIEKSKMKGDLPAINGVTYVDDLLPYIERKLFTVNTGHAATAYLGNYYGIQTIKDAIANENIRQIVRQIMKETGALLVKKYHFDPEEHNLYIEKILNRFENEYISDEVTRVARSPIRKLGANDRFIKPARELMEFGIQPKYLAKVIAVALSYKNNDDHEAIELQSYLKDHTVEQLFVKYSELSDCKELINLIIKEYDQIEKDLYIQM